MLQSLTNLDKDNMWVYKFFLKEDMAIFVAKLFKH